LGGKKNHEGRRNLSLADASPNRSKGGEPIIAGEWGVLRKNVEKKIEGSSGGYLGKTNDCTQRKAIEEGLQHGWLVAEGFIKSGRKGDPRPGNSN